MTPAPTQTRRAPAQQMVHWATSVLGTREGSGRESRWAAAAGISPTTAWCSAFVAYGLRKLGIRPPSDPAYSGSWLSWSGGEKVKGGIARARPGDLLIFDWGDGGRTDHVALYTGNGRMISGNDSNNSVGSSAVPTSDIVGIVRPKAFSGKASDGGGESLLSTVFGPTRRGFEDITGLNFEGGESPIANVGAQVVDYTGKLLGEKAPPILLNVGLLGGGAFLLYFGIARALGVGHPVGTPAKAYMGVAKIAAEGAG